MPSSSSTSEIGDTMSQDGFEVVSIESGEVVDFIACSYDERRRERVERGVLLNMDRDRFFVRDTREAV